MILTHENITKLNSSEYLKHRKEIKEYYKSTGYIKYEFDINEYETIEKNINKHKTIYKNNIIDYDKNYRVCRICKKEKILLEFPNHPHGKYGKDTRCKDCASNYIKKYHAEHRDAILPSRVEYHKKYREENREAVRASKRKYKKTLKARLSNNLRCRLYHVLKGNSKSASTMELVGCTIDFLKNYLEAKFTEGMNWATYGKDKTGWEIDHIKPCASFDLSKPEQQQKCFNYTNLQPLWANDNMSKGHKYDYIAD